MSLPESASVDLLAKEIGAVDGVAVEQIRPVADERPDSATAALQLAADVAETPPGGRLEALVSGLLLAADAESVGTGRGSLRLLAVQPEGKRTMSWRDFANGARPRPGEVFGDR